MSNYLCEVCGKSTKSISNLTKHKHFVHCEKKFQKCLICEKSFASKFHLKVHAAVHSDDSEISFFCFCSKAFKTRDDLMKHAKIHNKGIFQEKLAAESEIAKKTCNICGKNFSDSYCLRRHIKSIHEKSAAKKYLCGCGKVYTQQYDLKRHQIRNHSKDNQSFQCEICLKLFNLKGDLVHHFQNVHQKNLDNRKYSCLKCDLNFPGRKSLENHFLDQHTDSFVEDVNESKTNNLTCDVCLKTFKRFSNLNQHKKIHFRTTVYTCDYCYRDFSWKTSLKTHFKSCKTKIELNEQKDLKFQENFEDFTEFSEYSSNVSDLSIDSLVEAKNENILADFFFIKTCVGCYKSFNTAENVEHCDNCIDIMGTKEETAKSKTDDGKKILTKETGSKSFEVKNCHFEMLLELGDKIENSERILVDVLKELNVQKKNDLKVLLKNSEQIKLYKDQSGETEILETYEESNLGESASNDKVQSMEKLKFYCDHCKLNLEENFKFQRHMYYNHQNAKLFHCTICDEKFFNIHNLTDHQNSNRHQSNLRKEEPKKKFYECDFCHKTFKFKSILTNHMRAHSKNNFYYCKDCKRGFKYATSFMIHKRAHDKDNLGHKCVSCERKFVTKQNLNLHFNKHHTNNFQCGKCDKKFGSKRDLENHSKKHSAI